MPRSMNQLAIRVGANEIVIDRLSRGIFMFVNEDDLEGKDVGSSFNSNDLIGRGIPYSVYRYYGVKAYSSGGSSELSSKVKYFLLP